MGRAEYYETMQGITASCRFQIDLGHYEATSKLKARETYIEVGLLPGNGLKHSLEYVCPQNCVAR